MTEQLLQRYRRDLALRGYSPRTQETYYRNLTVFLRYCNEPPGQITRETIKNYLYSLISERKLSESSLRQARGAICYFFSQTMGMNVEVDNIPVQKKKKKLPEVLTVDEVSSALKHEAVGNTADHGGRAVFLSSHNSGISRCMTQCRDGFPHDSCPDWETALRMACKMPHPNYSCNYAPPIENPLIAHTLCAQAVSFNSEHI